MSERVRNSVVTSFLASKRLVISACAAIAMVLGAISSGASFIPNNGAERSQANTNRVLEGNSTASTAEVKEGIFNKQHAIEAQNLIAPTVPVPAIPEKRSPTTLVPVTNKPAATNTLLTTTQPPRDTIASDTAAGGSNTTTPPTTSSSTSSSSTTQPTDTPPADNTTPTNSDSNPPKPSDGSGSATDTSGQTMTMNSQSQPSSN